MAENRIKIREKTRGLKTAVSFAHDVISEILEPGDIAVDATLGNGHDAVFLARRVGRNGTVFAFDVQPLAHRQARLRILESEVSATIRLLKAGHESMGEVLPAAVRGRVKAIMFNLGYLPGGDKSIITRADTTIAALNAGLEVLAPGGAVTIVSYPGHPGGEEEAQAVDEWARNLNRAAYLAVGFRSLNQTDAPRAIAVERRATEAVHTEQCVGRNSALSQPSQECALRFT